MFTQYKELTSREAYEFYKENRLKVSEGINQYNYFKKAVEGLFLVISKMIVENEEGVCLKDIGYFCNIKHPNKRRRYKPSKSLMINFYKDYETKPYLFTDTVLKNWTMSDSFEPFLVLKTQKSGLDYKVHPHSCQEYIVAQDFSEKSRNRDLFKGDFLLKYDRQKRR